MIAGIGSQGAVSNGVIIIIIFKKKPESGSWLKDKAKKCASGLGMG